MTRFCRRATKRSSMKSAASSVKTHTIKDSNAFLAGDLRREIRHMLEDGLTDEQIFDFLVDRYGEFALYNPTRKRQDPDSLDCSGAVPVGWRHSCL